MSELLRIQNVGKLFLKLLMYVIMYKVDVFWERNKNLEKSPSLFWHYLVTSKLSGKFLHILWPSQNIWTLKSQVRFHKDFKPILYSYYIPPKKLEKRIILSFEGFDHARHVSCQGTSNNIRYFYCHRRIFHITLCIISIPC